MEKEHSFVHFLKYNNTVPIVLGILFLSTTATMAASPAVRDSVYTAESSVRSIDNSYIVSVDLEDYPFAMRITKVSEDDQYFYVAYEFDTIDVVDYVWQDAMKKSEMRIDKRLLRGGPLESYVENELAQLLAQERKMLATVQDEQKRIGISEKVVATEYSGLIGKFIEPSETRAPQYESEIDTNDPLYIKNPKPLVTWDANAEPEEVEENPDENEDDTDNNDNGGGNDTPPPPEDVCPDIEGTQTSTDDCPADTGEEPTPTEPPVEEPPVEGPPVEEEPTPEPEPEEEGSGGEEPPVE